MTRAQFLATPPRDLVRFVEGQPPIVEPKPKGVSQKAYDEHIDSAGVVVIVWRIEPDDGRRLETRTHDANSAGVVWRTNEQYNERWPDRDHRIYLYEVPGEHPIDIGRFAPKGNFEISYGDVDRIDLASWESAVVYALAHADAFGQVEAHTRTTVLPSALAPS